MIKCYIVRNVNKVPFGNFNINDLYIAKISNNNHNTYAVLDDDNNWIPFSCYSQQGLEIYSDYFIEIYNFHVKNKKELNNNVQSSCLYK